MSTTVFLTRHGQTKSNITGFYMGWSDEDLNELGFNQVERLSSRLACLPITSVYTSPLRRAYTTAMILAQPHKLEPIVLTDLIEINLGDWEGLHTDEIKQRWPQLWQQSRIDPSDLTMSNGESLNEVTQRAIQAFNTVVKANQGKQTVVVTHDAVIRVLVAHVLGVANSIYRRFDVGNASLTVITVGNGSLRLALLNDTSHLKD